ncbi:MAG: nucleotidyltransferase family protein [Propionibacteriaceae bacterium]|nr:nucleotidyltransferase family protein [Propionibacteriaceae bacterium]
MVPAGAAVVGVLLAAGAGRRAAGPKALRHDPDGQSWLLRSLDALTAGGCDEVVVVVGAHAAEVRRLLAAGHGSPPVGCRVVEATDWADGMGASLRAGLGVALTMRPAVVVVHLVDLPDVGPAVLRRLLQRVPLDAGVLARACYRTRPGHPVLLGADHLPRLLETLSGDRGAGAYLASRPVVAVECGDLAEGHDDDAPA